MFCWKSLAFSMIQWKLAISSLVPLPFLNPVCTSWKFLFHVMLKPSLKDFEHNFTSMESDCKCPVVWTFFSTALLGNWDEDWPFPVRWPLLLLLLSHFSCVRLYATPETTAHEASPSLGFSRQEHWIGLPFPSPMRESEKWKGSRSVVSNS